MFLIYLYILQKECDVLGTSRGLMTMLIVFLLCNGRNLDRKPSEFTNASLRGSLVDLENLRNS